MSQLAKLQVRSGTGSGDVVGPDSSTDNALARFDGITGKLIKNSGVILDNSNNMSGVNTLTITSFVPNRMVMTGPAGILQAPSFITDGHFFIGQVGGQPIPGTLTSNDGTVQITRGPGTIDLSAAGENTSYTPFVVDNSPSESLIDFDSNFVASNSIVATVDGTPLTAVPFNTNQATTMNDLATVIGAATGVSSATVTGARQILVVFTAAGHLVNSVVTTGGLTQPTASIINDQAAPFSTIQAALDAANALSAKLVLVRYGTGNYAEDLALYSDITIMGVLQDVASNVPVLVTGTHTPATTGSMSFVNLRMNDATSVISSASAGSASISFLNCNVGVTNGFTCDTTAWTGTITFENCTFSGLDDGLVNNATGTSTVQLLQSNVGGGAGVLITGGALVLKSSTLNCESSLTGSASGQSLQSVLSGITLAGTSVLQASGGILNGSSKPAITQNSTGMISIVNVEIDSNNNPAIDGTGLGLVQMGDVVFSNNANISTDLLVSYYGVDDKRYGAVQTTDDTPTSAFSLDLGAIDNAFTFEISVSGIEGTGAAAIGVSLYGAVRTDGATAVLISTPSKDIFSDTALLAASVDLIVSGNNAVVQVTGIPATTIDWEVKLQSVKAL
jgi:hypothetical protein